MLHFDGKISTKLFDDIRLTKKKEKKKKETNNKHLTSEYIYVFKHLKNITYMFVCLLGK